MAAARASFIIDMLRMCEFEVGQTVAVSMHTSRRLSLTAIKTPRAGAV